MLMQAIMFIIVCSYITCYNFKAIVHPKMKLLSFNNRHVVPTLYEFFLLNTKVDILKNVGNQTVTSSH